MVTRVKTAKGRKVGSTKWLERQLNDPYVKRAKAEGYRSRAAYKLIELDERFGFLKGAERVVDLGIAPGGWTQVVRHQSPRSAVVGIDLLETDPIEGATILHMDFMDEAAPERLKEALGGPADLVVAGCAILEAIMDIWPAETLGVADRGIREGILRSLMARDGLIP